MYFFCGCACGRHPHVLVFPFVVRLDGDWEVNNGMPRLRAAELAQVISFAHVINMPIVAWAFNRMPLRRRLMTYVNTTDHVQAGRPQHRADPITSANKSPAQQGDEGLCVNLSKIIEFCEPNIITPHIAFLQTVCDKSSQANVIVTLRGAY